jgi:hypothetical protein
MSPTLRAQLKAVRSSYWDQTCYVHVEFYILLTVHLDEILGNDQLDALFLNVFIS